ncbi:MAG: hypothetical protein AAFR94_10220 [Pseudomonadota bacterium]
MTMTVSKPPRPRQFSYLNDLRLDKNGLRVRQSETTIRLDTAFLRSGLSVLKLDAYNAVSKTSRALRGQKPAATIAFYPEQPPRWYNIYWVAHFSNLRIVSDLDEADYIFIFDDATISRAGSDLEDRHAEKAINIDIRNISKQHVADVFEEVFGYQLAVDPTVHEGVAVRKSQINGAHDGTLINCPIPPETVDPNYVYQRLIDSTYHPHRSEDLRIAYAFGTIATVFHKQKSVMERFGTKYLSVDVCLADDVFSQREQDLLIEFCRRAGLDFGAVDVMRDKNDGRIYVVDVNKTCMPVLSLPLTVQLEALRTISAAFASGLSTTRQRQTPLPALVQ